MKYILLNNMSINNDYHCYYTVKGLVFNEKGLATQRVLIQNKCCHLAVLFMIFFTM